MLPLYEYAIFLVCSKDKKLTADSLRKYVIFEEKDFEKIKSKKDKNITIEKFVNLSEVDPLYFRHYASFFLDAVFFGVVFFVLGFCVNSKDFVSASIRLAIVPTPFSLGATISLKIKSKKDKNITIEKFVNLSEVDPLYFDKPYYVAPTGAEKAFAVLLTAMEQDGKAAIAKTVLGTKETLILIRAKDGQMLLNTLFFEEEVTKNPAKEITEKGNAAELKMAKAIIEGMTGEFNPEDYRDEYRQKVQEAIERKIAGKEIVAPRGRVLLASLRTYTYPKVRDIYRSNL